MEHIENIVKRFAEGEILIVNDDEKRENESDLIVAIDKLTPEKVNFISRYGRGLICVALSKDIVTGKGFPFMPGNGSDIHDTAFLLSVDGKKTGTGISPYDRYLTAKSLADPSTSMRDFITPGHLFPLCARPGGLLERRGHTEAAVDLCRLAGITQAALICEIIGDDGNMISGENAVEFAGMHGLASCSIEDLVEYENLFVSGIRKVETADLSTVYGKFSIAVYEEIYKKREHVFLSMGDYKSGVVRIHSECLTGDVFASKFCDCGTQLDYALKKISEDKKGAILYLKQEGRDIGLGEKIKAYKLQQSGGYDTVEANIALGHKADCRDYHQAAWILKEEGYDEVRLMTNNPHKISALQSHGLTVIKENIVSQIYPENYDYLMTKKNKFGHLLDMKNLF